MACIGDSHTAGDHAHMAGLAANPTRTPCRMSDVACRGNYPILLGALLGPRYDVRNFGALGLSVCRDLPNECFDHGGIRHRPPKVPELTNPMSLNYHAVNQSLFPLDEASAPPDALSACSAALRSKSRLLAGALAFDPQVVVMLAGTNDASAASWDACAGAGTRQAFRLVLRELLRGPSPPLVLLLPPPPLLAEVHTGFGCTAMHACRYHPSKPCWAIAECVSCARGDLVDGACIRYDAMRHVRGIVHEVARDHERHAPGPATGSVPPARKCEGGRVRMLYPPIPRASSLLHVGPVHLNGKAMALHACAVHLEFMRWCDDTVCEVSAGGSAVAAAGPTAAAATAASAAAPAAAIGGVVDAAAGGVADSCGGARREGVSGVAQGRRALGSGGGRGDRGDGGSGGGAPFPLGRNTSAYIEAERERHRAFCDPARAWYAATTSAQNGFSAGGFDAMQQKLLKDAPLHLSPPKRAGS